MISRVVMMWPGLLFGNENPWLIAKEKKNGSTIPHARMSNSFKFCMNRAIKYSITYRNKSAHIMAEPNISFEEYNAVGNRYHEEIFCRY